MSILIDKDQNMRHDRILSNKSFHQYFPFKSLRHAFLCSGKFVNCCCKRKPRKSISDEA